MIKCSKRVALLAVFAVAFAIGLCSAEEVTSAPVAAAPNPQLEAVNARMQSLAEEFNEISGMMTSKANPSCQRCQAILRQFDGEFSKISGEYTNNLSRIGDGENAGIMFVKTGEAYNAKLASMLARYKRAVMAARPDSLCGKCGGPPKADD